MDQLPNYGDSRTLVFCAFCCGPTGTKDHCPSKVFLDEPLPANLPVVPACLECNNGFSADEEYLACLISCVLAGSAEPQQVERPKIQRILSDKPALRARLEQAKSAQDGQTIFIPDWVRVRNVLLKLAKGHALYEFHENCAGEPVHFSMAPLVTLSEEQREGFENPDPSSAWPEVGSRAMQRMLVGADVTAGGWIVVQEGRYRYNASIVDGYDVRIVINEYLAARACWD